VSGRLGLFGEDLVGDLLEDVLRRVLAVGVGLAVVREAGLLEPSLDHAVVAGLLREPFVSFLLVTLAKTGRYIAVAALVLS
jgi:hypothetical protein